MKINAIQLWNRLTSTLKITDQELVKPVLIESVQPVIDILQIIPIHKTSVKTDTYEGDDDQGQVLFTIPQGKKWEIAVFSVTAPGASATGGWQGFLDVVIPGQDSITLYTWNLIYAPIDNLTTLVQDWGFVFPQGTTLNFQIYALPSISPAEYSVTVGICYREYDEVQEI